MMRFATLAFVLTLPVAALAQTADPGAEVGKEWGGLVAAQTSMERALAHATSAVNAFLTDDMQARQSLADKTALAVWWESYAQGLLVQMKAAVPAAEPAK